MKLTILASVLFAALAIYLDMNHGNPHIEFWMLVACAVSFCDGTSK